MSRPTVRTTGIPAAQYARTGERIAEVSSDTGGFLLSLRDSDGTLTAEVYRADSSVTVRVPERKEQPWVNGPEVSGVTFDHERVTGTVRIAFTDYGRAFITTDAHVNDNAPAVNYRDREYLVSLHVTRNDDGTWAEHSPAEYDIRDRHKWPSGYAPPTYRAAIVRALLQVVSEQWSEETGRLAGYACAARDLSHADGEYGNARAALHNAQDRVNGARARMAQYRP